MIDEITSSELRSRIEAGEDPQVIDVRSPAAFERGHIPGAENVPLPRLVESIDDHEWENDIVVVCPHGESSLQAARLLAAYEGVADDARIANLVDGLSGWEGDLVSASTE